MTVQPNDNCLCVCGSELMCCQSHVTNTLPLLSVEYSLIGWRDCGLGIGLILMDCVCVRCTCVGESL